VDAFRLWWPELDTVAWRGAPAKRHALAGKAHVYVTSYDTAVRDASNTRPHQSPLVAIDPRTLIVDECHYIKNPGASRTKAVRRLALNIRAFVALSGTPITHHADDLWPTLRCLAPGAWPSRERWFNRYMQVVPGDYKDTVVGLNPWTEPEFRLTLLGQHRRVARADVMSQLPPKVYSVRTVAIPAAYRKAYDAMEKDMLAQLPDGGEISVMSVLAQLTRLSQLSCAAADVSVTTEVDDYGMERPHYNVTLKAPSWKVDALLEVLDERPGERTVCFSVSAQLCRLAGAAATKAGHRVGYIIGGQSMKERTATIAAFQNGELDLICATTGAGGVGITLSNAGTLVFLQRPWSLVESLQAEDRAEGDLTQTRGTEIIDIIAAKTIDTRVRSVLHEKAGALSELVQDPRIVAELLGGASVRKLRKVS
jgi:SNF2 family DNA or RNA helicase